MKSYWLFYLEVKLECLWLVKLKDVTVNGKYVKVN